MSIVSRLLKIRKRERKTQPDFAKELGVSARAYANYELGDRDLPLAVVIKLHELYGINLQWLLFGKGQMDHSDLGELVNNVGRSVGAVIIDEDSDITKNDLGDIMEMIFIETYNREDFTSEDIERLINFGYKGRKIGGRG